MSALKSYHCCPECASFDIDIATDTFEQAFVCQICSHGFDSPAEDPRRRRCDLVANSLPTRIDDHDDMVEYLMSNHDIRNLIDMLVDMADADPEPISVNEAGYVNKRGLAEIVAGFTQGDAHAE